MFSQQGVLGLGVVELLVHALQGNALPSAGVVTGLAALYEASFVRIGVAVRTLAEGQSHIARLGIGAGRMTLRTGDLGVLTGQRVLGPGMIELRDILPVFEIVALLAILPQPAVMLIFVTGYASLRNAEKRLGRIANLDAELLGG